MNPEIRYFEKDRKYSESWRDENDQLHRLDGPAERTWYDGGGLKREAWFVGGRLHRLDGPAIRLWDRSGHLKQESWYANGTEHRLDGPVHQRWHRGRQLPSEEWFINGVQYKTEAEFQVAADLYKANEIAELF